jgi:TP901 family phage tail tape measure protein
VANETKSFTIKTIYDSQGLKAYSNDLTIARSVSRRFAIELSDNAKILEQTTSRSFNRAGQAVNRTTAIIQDSGRKIKVVYDQMSDRTNFVSASFVKFRDNIAQTGLELQKLVARAGLVIPVWLLLRSAFTGVLNVIRDSLKFMIDWEFQMAQIRIVSNNTEQEIQNLSRSLLTLSRTLGISNSDIALGSKLYVQQGLAIKEIIPLMDATAKLSLLTGRTITQSVEDLTAILKAYKLESTEAIRVVDALTNVELVHAVTTADLTEALKQVASTAATTGISLESLIGFITAIKSETRDTANRVGLSLRTMFARISTSSAESLQTLTGVPFFLDDLGNATTQVTPIMRNLESVITELALVFPTLTNAQQAQVAHLVGGTHRLNQAFALFNNFTEGIQAQADALFSLGKADKAIGILTDTTELRIKKLKGAWDEFIASVADTSAIKEATGFLTDLIQGTTAIVNPDEAFRSGLIDQLTQSQQQATRQEAFASALLDVQKRAEELAKIVERNPEAIEQARIQTAIWAERINEVGREFGIAIDRSVELPGQLAGALNQQLSTIKEISVQGALDVIKRDIQKDLVNISTDIRKIIGENFKGQGLLGEGTFQGRQKEGFFANLITTGLEDELKEARKIFIDFQNGIFISPEQGEKLRNTFKNLLDEKDFADFSRLVNELVQAQESLISVESRRSQLLDQINAKLEEQNRIQQSNRLTQEQIEEKLLQIERNAIENSTDRLSIINQEIDLLKSQEDTLEGVLETRLRNLETEKLSLEVARRRAETESRQRVALNQLTNRGATNLQILIQELAFLEKIGAKEDEIRQKREQIAIERQNVEKNAIDAIVDAQIDLLKIQGQSEIQLIQSRLELEKRLGIEREGLDALRQQLELAKAIAKENQKSREDRLKELRQAIIDRRKEESPSRQARLDLQESNLVFSAKFAGFSQEEIDKILRPAESVKNLLPDSLDNLAQKNDDLGFTISDLARAVDGLTEAVLREESRRLDLSTVRTTLNPEIQTKPTIVEPAQPRVVIAPRPGTEPTIVFQDGAFRIEITETDPDKIDSQLRQAFDQARRQIVDNFNTRGTNENNALRKFTEEF